MYKYRGWTKERALLLLNWIFHSFVTNELATGSIRAQPPTSLPTLPPIPPAFLATVGVTTDLATTHLVADLAADELATIHVDIYPYTDDYMDTYLVADLATDLAAALATADLIHDFATIDLATLRRPHHWRRSPYAINMPPMMSAVARSTVTSMVGEALER